MRAAASSPLRPLPEGHHRRTGARRGTSWALAALVAAALLALLLAIGAQRSSERRALRALPREERLALVSRSVDELRRLCGDGRPGALEDHCRELASFVAQLDECRGECQALVRQQLTPAPTR